MFKMVYVDNAKYYEILGVSKDASQDDLKKALVSCVLSTGKMFKMVYVDNAKYYEILGVSKDASQDDLKKAYREAARKYILIKFKELAQAYRDPKKREIYNLHRQDIVRTLKVSLTDLYNGTSKKENFSRIAICSNCKGKGSKSGASIMTCSACCGSGMVPHIRHFIPGMQHPCYLCKGTGETLSETIDDEDRCEQCKGRKIVREKVVLEVHVEKGMQDGQKITFTREVVPTIRGGGVVFIIQQEEHPKFKRKGDDLFVEHTLSPQEALSGFQFGLTHLDDRKLIIISQPGEVVQHGEFKAINDEGMPMYERPSMRGKLYIHFTVEFPDALTLTPREAAMKHHSDKSGDPQKDEDDDDARKMDEGVDGDIEALNYDDLDSVSKLQKTERYNDIMQKVDDALEKGSWTWDYRIIVLEDDPQYQLIVDCNALLVDVENEVVLIHNFIRDNYRLKFPELESLVHHPIDYARVVKKIGNETDLTLVDLEGLLPSAVIMVVYLTASTTSGKPLPEDVLQKTIDACDRALTLDSAMKKVLDFVESRMGYVAPNLSAVVGSVVAAKLIGAAGGLTSLAEMPACDVQQLLEQTEVLQSTPAAFRMRAGGLLAAKSTLAAQVDSFRGRPSGAIGTRFREELTKQIERWQEPPPAKQPKPLLVPDSEPMKMRGGRRLRRMEERYAAHNRLASRMQFGIPEREFIGGLSSQIHKLMHTNLAVEPKAPTFLNLL